MNPTQVVDPAAVAARLAREAELDKRIAERVAAEQKELDERGEKICTNYKECAQPIPRDATRCPVCGKRQGQSASGQLSGANRDRRHYGRVVTIGGTQ